MPSAILISHYLPNSKVPSLVNYIGRHIYTFPTFINRISKLGCIRSGYVTTCDPYLDTIALYGHYTTAMR